MATQLQASPTSRTLRSSSRRASDTTGQLQLPKGAADQGAFARVALAGVETRQARKVCSCATTAAPSPDGRPHRFTEPQRTSPTAKIPSTPVSSGSGTRPVERTSAPVRMKPFSSRGDAGAGEPARGRIGAGEEEQVGDGVLLLGPGAPVAPAHALQTLVGRAEELHDLGVAEHRDVRGGRDPIDKVAGHGAREAGPAHQTGEAQYETPRPSNCARFGISGRQ